jgi:tetratricopeptide (TPR) repeat protein
MKAESLNSQKQSRVQREPMNAAAVHSPNLIAEPGWFLLIFGCAFVLRLIYLWQIESIPLFYDLAGDGRTYDEWAQRIAAGDWLGEGVFYQAPLYPYFLGVLQIFVGHNLWLIRFIQIVLGALSCALIFVVGQKLFSRGAGIAAGLILAGYAPAVFYEGLIEKSILDLFLLTALLFLQFGIDEVHSWVKWLGSGALLGLLGLSRENALLLAPILALWIWFVFVKTPIAARLRWVALFVGGLLLVLVPVGLRNLTVGGEFKLTTSQFGANFFIGNNPSADGTYASVRNQIGAPQLEGSDATRLAERSLGRMLAPGEVSSYWFQRSWNYVRSYPGAWLALLVKKWGLVWNFREIEDSDDFYIYQKWSWLLRSLGWFSHFGMLAPLAAVGVLLTLKDWRRLWLLHAMIISLAVSVTIFYVFGRYRFPLVPLLALFAGAGVVTSIGLCKERNWQSLFIAFAILLSSAVIVNWPMTGESGPGPAGYNNLSNAYYRQGKIDDAIEAGLRAIELQPDYGVAHFNLGNSYAQQGKFDLARRHFEEVLRLYPNYAEGHSNFGQLLAERGDLETGIRYFKKAIELNPSLSRAHANLGVALAKQGRMAEAVRPLQEAVRLSPESAEASFYLGSVYAAQNRYAEAAESFNQALRIQPDFAAAHQSLAQILLLQGKKEEALRHYQEAVRLMKQGVALPGKG